MEEWGYVDECELQNWKGGVVCMTWQHFIYGVHQHCPRWWAATSGRSSCNKNSTYKKRCKLWAPIWQKEVGWASEAG